MDLLFKTHFSDDSHTAWFDADRFFNHGDDPRRPGSSLTGPLGHPENVTRVKAELGLDKPLYQQYFIWMHNLISGDFGRSFVLNRPVVDEVLERFSATLILGGCALLLSSLLGLLAGIFSAIRQFSWSDRTLTLAVLLGSQCPLFGLGY